MSKSIVASRKYFFIILAFIQIIKFFLSYIRMSFLIFSALLLVVPLVVIIIFFQDQLGISLVSEVAVFLGNLPMMGKLLDMPIGEGSIDEVDLKYFFLKISFYLTIISEIIRIIKKYVFKKEIINTWKSLRRRSIIVVTGIAIVYGFVYGYLLSQDSGENAGWWLLILGVFWLMCSGSFFIFLFMGFKMKQFYKKIDEFKNSAIILGE